MAEHQLFRKREVYVVDSRAYIGNVTDWKFHITEGHDGIFPEFNDMTFKSPTELGLMVGREYGKQDINQAEAIFIPCKDKRMWSPMEMDFMILMQMNV
jgi:hypothetical protein